jgi:CRP-like cAMP-binding protein
MESKVREFAKGSTIFRRGEPGNTAFILTEGTVEIFITEGKNKTVLGVLHPISVFGEMALLLKNQQRTASAIAKSDAKLAEISRKDFDDFFKRSPKLISAVLQTMVERLEQTNARVSQSPDLYIIITEMLNLLILHDRISHIGFNQVIDCIENSYKLDSATIIKTMNFLQTLGLIEIRADRHNAVKLIEIIKPTDFIERARHIHATFTKMGSSPETGFF